MTDVSALLEMISRKGPILMRAQTGKCKGTVKPKLKEDLSSFRQVITTERERKAMARLYAEHGFSVYQIARIFDRDRSGVTKQLIAAGVKIRTKSEAAQGRLIKSKKHHDNVRTTFVKPLARRGAFGTAQL